MAIYHFSSQIFTRSKGESSVGKAAYRSAERLTDERIGIVFDYRNKSDLFHKEILLPKGAPQRLLDRNVLWNEVEATEKRKDAQVARELTISLPKELSVEQNIKLACEFLKDKFADKGMVVDVCLHSGHGHDQPHMHVMLTMREVNEYGFGQKVVEWNKKPLLYEWREEWANYTNKHLAKAGFDLKIDHRSNKERGIDLEPQNKIGPNGGRERLTNKIQDHQEIARRNGDRILNNPSVAIDALTKYKSTFTEIDLAKFLNTHTADKEQFDAVFAKVKACKEIVKLGIDDDGKERFTSNEMIDLEYRMVRQAQALSEMDNHIVSLVYRERIGQEYKLSEAQNIVFRHITGDRDAACVVGYAGSGKSYVLGAAKKVWDKTGYNVIGMTLSGIAAENLEAGSGIVSHTVANRLVNWEHDRERLTKNDIVVVDEAGMLGSRDLAKIMDEATLAKAKVLLIGDIQQLQSIEAGAAFRGVLERIGHVDLNEIRRQKITWQKEATKSLALGEIGEAMLSYAKRNMVHEFTQTDEAKENMVNAWHEVALTNSSSIMMAYTRSDVKALNERAREVKKSYGELNEEFEYKTALGKRPFAEGDRLYFLKNHKDLGVKNGTLATITNLNGYHFEVQLDKGGKVKFDIRDYNNVDHGYAATIHKAQGVTVDKSFVLLSQYMDRHSTYVGMSRHRESVEIYWAKDKFYNYEKMVSTLSRENRKDLALDYVNKDILDNTRAFAQNKNIESDKKIDLKARDDLEHYSKYSKVLALAKDLISKFKYSFVDYNAEGGGNYLGKVEVDGKQFAVLDQNGIGACILEDVNISTIELGDKVELVGSISQEGISYKQLVKDTCEFDEASYVKCEYAKQQASVTKIARKMMSKENHYIDKSVTTKDIYTSLYDKLATVLPEFGFVRKGSYYVSTTECKVDGGQGKKGKVYVYENNPGLIVDYTRGNISIWEYIARSEGLEHKEVFAYLATAAGIKEYFDEKYEILRNNTSLNESLSKIKYEKEDKEESKIAPELWNKVYEYALNKMEIKNNQVSRYVKEERGYLEEVIKACGIGYIASRKELAKCLEVEGYDSEQLKDLSKALGCIGYSHKMVLPFYDRNGELIGLVGRDIKHHDDSKYGKYIYSKGLARSSTMLGIEKIDSSGKLTIVEGMLDILHARAVGIKNVVALGGSGINSKQLDLLVEVGIKEVTLCLDNDRAGHEATRNIALQIYTKEPEITIKEVKLPDNIKDLDQLIKEKGVVKAEACIKAAKEMDTYELSIEKEMKTMPKFQKVHEGYEFEIGMKNNK